MVLDLLENSRRYRSLGNGFSEAFEFLLRPDLKGLKAGKIEIMGERVVAIISRNPGRKREGALLETHEAFIDIQLLLSGTETMGWKPKSSCRKPSGEYDPRSDLQFFGDEPDLFLLVPGGAFVVFFPEDAHMPMIASEEIHKVVVKIAVTPV